jgi:hypothetical protein
MMVPLGHIVATPGALHAIITTDEVPDTFLNRHANGDWGDVSAEDAKLNDAALLSGERLLSAYVLSNGTRIWIITESDRSATTILLPEEY